MSAERHYWLQSRIFMMFKAIGLSLDVLFHITESFVFCILLILLTRNLWSHFQDQLTTPDYSHKEVSALDI